MEWFNRLVGNNNVQRRQPTRSANNDPQSRLLRFKRVFNSILEIVNKPRNPSNERPLLDRLHATIDRLVILTRDESRASVPHLCLQYAASSQLYTVIGRAALVSQYEPVISSAVTLFAALVDSEEEDFLANQSFAKSLMRLATKVADSGNVRVGVETETAILELLFTISAKIRLQPEILPVWFRSSAKPELEDVFVREKKSFVGITSKADFPLCYLLIDRVHHEGRLGDFARTGLLYIFEATGRSTELEEWILSSDVPTLMASGLGALYSQLSRELSILHLDSTLPPLLAMSDYTTTHPRATAESAFSERHQAHMSTFLSYLLFWQDVLDHCRSADVKETLMDHFQILFLRQLLYPSLLQSSDTDAGSSVAVLTYVRAMLEALEYPELVRILLTYLLALTDEKDAVVTAPTTPVRPTMPPRSPTTMRRRQSLMLLTAPKDPDSALEPDVFNLTDLLLNSIQSTNASTVFAGLKLVSTMLVKQRYYALRSLLHVRRATDHNGRISPDAPPDQDEDAPIGLKAGSEMVRIDGRPPPPSRTIGALETEVKAYADLVQVLYEGEFPESEYDSLCDDLRYVIESQSPLQTQPEDQQHGGIGVYDVSRGGSMLRAIIGLLRTFLTNSVDVNLALTETVVALATCSELRLDSWFALDPASSLDYTCPEQAKARSWQTHLEGAEISRWSALQRAFYRPQWRKEDAPLLHNCMSSLIKDLDTVQNIVPDFRPLLAARRHMLQASASPAEIGGELQEGNSGVPPMRTALPEAQTQAPSSHGRSSSMSSRMHRRNQSTIQLHRSQSPEKRHVDQATSPPTSGRSSNTSPDANHGFPTMARSIFQPPPPEQPSTTDVLMRKVVLPSMNSDDGEGQAEERSATLNHVLTNIVVLQHFALELLAVLQVRASVFGERELRYS